MRLRSTVCFAGMSCVLAFSSAVPARAIMIAPAPISQRVATADAVVVGKVTSIEPKTVKAARFPGDTELGEFRIAVVKIDEGLVGVKGLTHVRVGFLLPPDQGAAEGTPRIRISSRRPQATLDRDEEVCLFLKAHPDGTFFTLPMYFDVIRKPQGKEEKPTFANEIAEAKRCARLLENPVAGLKTGSAAQRFETAAMLVTRYRGTPTTKSEPIDATESKLILDALADADWGEQKPVRFNPLSPLNVFLQLGLTPKDGWTVPKDFRQIATEAKKWLAANNDRYRVQRFVNEKAPAP